MDLAPLPQYLMSQPLLALALAAMLVILLGGALRHLSPRFGNFVRALGNIGLLAALVLTVLQVARVNQGLDLSLPGLGMPVQEVSGTETRVPMDEDGHFWIRARVNGVPHRFLVDTGATLTAIDPGLAAEAGAVVQSMRQPVLLRTANGTVPAQLATLHEVRIGNVLARDLDAVIAPGMEGTSVLGMNFLSRLASWRVEGQTLILVPHHPQEAGDRASNPA
ncbi:TIGR02281 family clan AA aspartic protease [Novosphingobium flavum]|uniref:TIGR02281 family clan AA aspartic protease n=1 Tax=Novosphingobium flavum TaxID=1778672 RepID=A0A7X1FQL4_9SPHN|nr:TIGR02281 family clan AA aspartic protease [Novosphingobium flavum]MBC2665019.1 TIGR02281 family clan AA aspartic protease [Novosphingobium flavum]